MKTFTFNVNKKSNTSNNNNNASAYINDVVLSNLKKVVPYAFTSGVIDEDYEPTIVLTPKKTKKVINIDVDVTTKPKMKDAYTEFMDAVKYLSHRNDLCDTYDFLMADGTPVKIFADEIQIGYTLIPLKKFTKKMYNKLSTASKKTIIDIYVKIKK